MKHSKTPWTYTISPSTLRVFIHEDGDPAGPIAVLGRGYTKTENLDLEANAAHIVRCVNIHEALVGALKRIISENALNGSMSHDGWQQGAAALRLAEANEEGVES
jgi:hypothetical protein